MSKEKEIEFSPGWLRKDIKAAATRLEEIRKIREVLQKKELTGNNSQEENNDSKEDGDVRICA